MEKTTLQQAIDKLAAGRKEAHKDKYDCSSDRGYVIEGEERSYDYAELLLKSLLPAERQAIEAAWADGMECGSSPDQETDTASDYFTSTYTNATKTDS